MRKVKFSDCVEYMIKGPFGSDMKKSLYVPKGDNTYKVYVQVNAIQRNQSLGEYYVSEEYFHKKLERFEVHPGDYLITCDGTLGKFIKLDENSEKGVISSSLLLLKLKEDVIYDKYFELIWEYSMLGYLASQARNACLIHLPSAKAIGDVEIILPDLAEQIELADRAFSVSDIVEKRKTELALFDNLIKARFVEMFGDPNLNPFGWKIVNISEVVGGKVSNGFFAKRDDYCDDGNVSVLGVANIVNRMYSKVDELPKTNADSKDVEKYEVKYGDMLFCRSSLVAEGIGKASIVPENVQNRVLFECHVIRLPLDLEKCVPEFMQVLSTMDFFRNQVIAQSKTATMTTIGQDGILNSDIILPPIEKQREFYHFVKQVDKSKVIEIYISFITMRKVWDWLRLQVQNQCGVQ